MVHLLRYLIYYDYDSLLRKEIKLEKNHCSRMREVILCSSIANLIDDPIHGTFRFFFAYRKSERP